jgi:hypothetical protein
MEEKIVAETKEEKVVVESKEERRADEKAEAKESIFDAGQPDESKGLTAEEKGWCLALRDELAAKSIERPPGIIDPITPCIA